MKLIYKKKLKNINNKKKIKNKIEDMMNNI